MKLSTLYREWARVLDMCQDTKVNPKDCWKHKKEPLCAVPSFDGDLDEYEFAVGILEDRPVFVGDELYLVPSDQKFIWPMEDPDEEFEEFQKYLSFSPRRTFTLNGVEMPRPIDVNGSNHKHLLLVGDHQHSFHWYAFETVEERKLFKDNLHKIISEQVIKKGT